MRLPAFGHKVVGSEAFFRRTPRNYHMTDRRGRMFWCGCCACMHEYVGQHHQIGSMQKGKCKHLLERSKYNIRTSR